MEIKLHSVQADFLIGGAVIIGIDPDEGVVACGNLHVAELHDAARVYHAGADKSRRAEPIAQQRDFIPCVWLKSSM